MLLIAFPSALIATARFATFSPVAIAVAAAAWSGAAKSFE
jgi:hypothetical protein